MDYSSSRPTFLSFFFWGGGGGGVGIPAGTVLGY